MVFVRGATAKNSGELHIIWTRMIKTHMKKCAYVKYPKRENKFYGCFWHLPSFCASIHLAILQ